MGSCGLENACLGNKTEQNVSSTLISPPEANRRGSVWPCMSGVDFGNPSRYMTQYPLGTVSSLAAAKGINIIFYRPIHLRTPSLRCGSGSYFAEMLRTVFRMAQCLFYMVPLCLARPFRIVRDRFRLLETFVVGEFS